MRALVAIVVVALAITAPARAEDDAAAQARAFFEVGAQAYERGDYASAIEAFEEAYARAERPGLLFSIAQAHRRAFFATNDGSQLKAAIDSYRKYLASNDEARRKDAEEALAQLVPLFAEPSEAPNETSPAPRVAKLMVASTTPDAELWVDGVKAPRLPHVATVQPGEHTVVVRAPGYREESRTLPLPEGSAFALDITLERLPGRLAVKSRPGANLWLDGRLIGTLPLPELRLSPGRHRLSVTARGRRVVTQRVNITAGGETKLSLELVPSRQRRTSIGLFWGGGGLVAGSIASLIVALDRQQDARELLRQRDRGSLTSTERDRYDDLVARRNRLRATAVGLGTVGALSLVVGAVLYSLDRPEVPGLYGEDSAPDRPAPKAAPSEIMAGPIWDGDTVGVAASARF